MTDKELLDIFKPLVEFISKLLGANSEVVLHDLSDYDHSIIKIENGHITNRSINDGVTDFSLRFLKENASDSRPYLTNYTSLGVGNRKLRSSTFFIKNKDNIIGLLCVNSNDEDILDIIRKANSLLIPIESPENGLSISEDTVHENFNISVNEMAYNVVNDYTVSKGVSVEYLKQDDKLEIVASLNKLGFFLLKGSISKLSDLLSTSEASIYRYLQQVKK